jgi:hypothetical protein
MKKRKRRTLQVLAISAMAISGFVAAGALAGIGLAGGSTSTDTTSTSTSTSTTTSTTTTTTTTTTTGGEGCTPGYWKQPQHFDSWPVPLSTTLAGAGFTNTGWPAGTTLLEALSFQGGPTVQDAKNILLRQAAAAYLNSLSIAYAFTTADVVSMVNDALASGDRDTILDVKDVLDAANNGGCPLH